MKIEIIIITSNSLRHRFFAESLCRGLEVKKVFIEGNFSQPEYIKYENLNIVDKHFAHRHNSEIDFFSDNYNLLESKLSFIQKDFINSKVFLDQVKDLKPNLIITYGCSIIRGEILNLFKDRIINIHLGISPYYKGSGTNFHALVNNEFKYFGYSIIYMNEEIDGGEIIHQSQADFFEFDSPHTVGNRLIKKMVFDTLILLENFHLVERKKIPNIKFKEKYFKRRDSNEFTVSKLYKHFRKNLISYLQNHENDKKIEIITQSFIK